MGTKKTAATPALTALEAAGVVHRVHTFAPSDCDYGAQAARALAEQSQIAAERVFKTLVLACERSPRGSRERLAVAVLPVTGTLDLKAAAAALGCGRASLAPAREAERATGYVLGGVSPLGQRRRLPTVVDASATGHETVLCSAGRRGWDVELDPAELVRLTDAVVAPVVAGRGT